MKATMAPNMTPAMNTKAIDNGDKAILLAGEGG